MEVGGSKLYKNLHDLIAQIWNDEVVPQDWKDASFVPIFKKGNRKQCGNYRGILLLSIAGKIMSSVILNRINQNICPNILLETQSGFRSGRSTMDMIFSLKQIQEKCVEQNMPLYVVFIDFSKTFDTISRDGLWLVLNKFGCTYKIINQIQALHNGMQAQVMQNNARSDSFAVTNGVKQGCVLTPTLFSLYLTAILEVAFKNSEEGVYIQTRHNADRFKVSHFKAKTRTTMHLVRELLFADDSALVAHSASEMQSLVTSFTATAELFSLKINIKKTECLFQPAHPTSTQTEPIIINIQLFVQATEFTYLGSIISDNARLNKEIRNRIGKASASFEKL